MRAASFAAGFALAMVAGASLYVLADDDVDRYLLRADGSYVTPSTDRGRPSSDAWLKIRQQAFERAGVSYLVHHHDYEVDHIIPCCLDRCDNSLENLQLQRCTKWEKLKNGRDGPRCLEGEAADKDEKERSICRSYHAGKMTLDQARSSFQRTSP